MNDGLPCFVILIGLAIAMAIAWVKRARSRDLGQAYQSVARWFHGRVIRRGWWSTPSVIIPYNQATIEVRIGISELARSCTQARIVWGDFTTPLRLYSNQSGLRPLGKRAGVAIGDPEWDRHFTVECLQPEVARAMLSGGVRSAAIMLSRIRRSGGVDIQFGQGELIVHKLMILDQASELSAFVRHVMEIFDQSLLARSTGIEFVEHTHLQVIEDAKCPVCGDQIEDELVFCSRCKTPHHRECWNYNGRCATYACGELNYAAPRVGKRR